MKRCGREVILYCDFDGTIIKQDIERELIQYLHSKHYLAAYQYMFAVITFFINFIRKKLFRGGVLKSWSAFITEKKRSIWIDEFLRQDKKLSLNEQAINYIKNIDAHKIVLTGSETALVEDYLEKVGLNKEFKHVCGSVTGKKGFRIMRHPYGKDKCKYLDINAYKIGIANEWADHFYLEKCDEVVVVSPEKKLELFAKEKGWQVL